MSLREGTTNKGLADHGRGISGDGAGDVDYGRSCQFWAFHHEDGCEDEGAISNKTIPRYATQIICLGRLELHNLIRMKLPLNTNPWERLREFEFAYLVRVCQIPAASAQLCEA
jgi:hypothetical protein